MIFLFDAFELDAERLELRRDGKLMKVDALVTRLLVALVENAGQLVTKDELVDEVWEGRDVADNVITVSMARLRKTLDDKRGEREFVLTVYGRGYRFVRPVVARSTAKRSSIPQPDAGDVRPPFVGRERPLARLRHALSEARSGRGRLCVLMGEPGIGKTRVIENLTRSVASQPVRVAWGFCREAGDTPPLWPWRQLLLEMTDAAPGNETRGTPREPAEAQPAVAEVRDLLQQLGVLDTLQHERTASQPPTSSSSQGHGTYPDPLASGTRHRSFELILRAFMLLAKTTPWLLVLDDLHRADAASLELLSHLVDQIAHTKILMVATMRPAPGGKVPRLESHLPYALGHRNCERIVLERLREEDVLSYVAALIEDPDGRFGKAVFEKSEGNPFFMAELSRQLRETDSPELSSLEVPDAALELVRQRVARLDVDARGVLSAAAVIGRSFELSLLSAVTGREPGALIGSLDGAIAAEVVVAAPDSLTAFAFGHELLRVVLYESLTPAEQRRGHLGVARMLEQRAQAGDGIPASELAYHYHAALPETDLRKTVHFCRNAATDAAAVYANTDVVRYTRNALEALELIDKPSVRLRMSLLYLTTIYIRGHDSDGFARALAELMRLAAEHQAGPMLVRGATMLNWHPGFQPMPGGSAALKQALSLLTSDGSGGIGFRAVGLAALACAAPECFAGEQSRALIEEAVPLVRKSGSRAARYAVLLSKLYVMGGPAHEQVASDTLEELTRLSQENPKSLPILPIDLAGYRAITALTRGDAAATNAAIERAVLCSRELHHYELLWHCERFRALSRINMGAFSEGLGMLEVLHQRSLAQNIWGTAPFCAFDRAVVLREHLDVGPVDEALRLALTYQVWEPPSVWSMKVRALASAGLRDDALATLHAVPVAALAKLPCDSQFLGTLGHLTRAALLLGERDYQRALYELLSPYPERYCGHVSFLCEGAVAQLLGMLSRAEGRHGEAIAQLEVGIAANERANFLPRAAETRLLLAQCLLEEGTARGARRALGIAREVHDSTLQLGLPRLAREASELLQSG